MVYVDDARVPHTLGPATVWWSHMFADTPDELHAMARLIGLRPGWFVNDPIDGEHYQLTDRFRAAAVAQGAVQVQL